MDTISGRERLGQWRSRMEVWDLRLMFGGHGDTVVWMDPMEPRVRSEGGRSDLEEEVQRAVMDRIEGNGIRRKGVAMVPDLCSCGGRDWIGNDGRGSIMEGKVRHWGDRDLARGRWWVRVMRSLDLGRGSVMVLGAAAKGLR